MRMGCNRSTWTPAEALARAYDAVMAFHSSG
jgi:hypothetical protein